MFVAPEADPRAEGDEPEGEKDTLIRYLRDQRLTLSLKCAGLDAQGMARRSVEPSDLSLLGLVRHLAGVEQYWFRIVMAGQDVPRLYRPGGDRQAVFTGAVADPAVVAEAWAAWRSEVAFAEQYVDAATDLGATGVIVRDGQNLGSIALRSVMLHMIEEYARHLGHADLLRERIDGRVGQ